LKKLYIRRKYYGAKNSLLWPYCGFVLAINGTYTNILAQELKDSGFNNFLYTEKQLKEINDKISENFLFIFKHFHK